MNDLYSTEAHKEAQSFIKSDAYKEGRRDFLRSLGIGALGAAVFGAAEGDFSAAEAQTVRPLDVANFALNFEYLGAQYYLHSVTGQGLSASDMGAGAGTTSGGAQVPFQNAVVKALAINLAVDERNHVERLRAVLGGSAAPQPNINIGTAFTTLARAANLPLTNGQFNPYANDTNFLLGAYVFEDTCVTALIGGAALVQGTQYLPVLGGFLGVEAYQAGSIRTMLFSQQNQQIMNDTMAISQTRSALANNGNPNVDDYGIGSPNSPHLVNANANSLAYPRTSRQILNIAYGAVNAGAGLFFPNGLNGVIR